MQVTTHEHALQQQSKRKGKNDSKKKKKKKLKREKGKEENCVQLNILKINREKNDQKK